jgi:flavorubredoxin
MQDGKIGERISWVGVVDWDRRLFDSLIPLPDGTTYNAWLVRGSEKTALIDTVDPAFTGALFDHLKAAGVESLDYVVTNHAEQDHSGSLPAVLARFPNARVLCTEKCRGMLGDLLHVPEDRVDAVADGSAVSLGDRTLKFVHFPWVHWPETMLTWVPEERVLFSCDLFGSHLAQCRLFPEDCDAHLVPAKRYFAEIMMPFRAVIEKNMPKVLELAPKYICPSHGPAHDRPLFITSAYGRWLSPAPLNLATVAYVSMHESTRMLVRRLVDSLSRNGVRVEQFELSGVDLGKLAISLVDAATIILGVPTVLGGAHPLAANAVFLANALRPKAKNLAILGSYGWGGKMVEQLSAISPNLKVDVLPPLLVKGMPREADLQAADRLAAEIAKRHEGLA